MSRDVALALKTLDRELQAPAAGSHAPHQLALCLAQLILQNIDRATDVPAMKQSIWEPVLQMVREVAGLEGFLECVQEWEHYWPEPVEAPAARVVVQVVQGSEPSHPTTPASADPPDSMDLTRSPPSSTTVPVLTSQSDSIDLKDSLHSATIQHHQRPASRTDLRVLLQKMQCW
jgi:hypothetical protein